VVEVEQFKVELEEIQGQVVVDEVEQTLLLVVVLVHLILVVEVEVLEILQDQVEVVVQE
tara:strand:- start:947 stop:1123 length:177 start_codon:yes stop_codon:yes gene_type:complete